MICKLNINLKDMARNLNANDIYLIVCAVYLVNWAGALGWWLAPLFFMLEFGSFPGLVGLKGTQMFIPHPLVKISIVGSF